MNVEDYNAKRVKLSQMALREQIVFLKISSSFSVLRELGHMVGRIAKFWVDFLHFLVLFVHVKRRKARSEENEG